MRQVFLLLALLSPFTANAAFFQFNGNLANPNDTQLINFSMSEEKPVTLRTTSYFSSSEGFDTMFALFRNTGEFIDIYFDDVSDDILNLANRNYDTDVTLNLVGDFVLALLHNPNNPVGDLKDGFCSNVTSNGCERLTTFNDFDGRLRTSHWALEIDGADKAELGGYVAAPIPAAAWLFGSALMGLFGIKRKPA